jgi:phosphoglycolate phosphatase/putative hydrolase of the HAD superfamily
MKAFSLPKKINAVLFDMDLTLYSDREYGQSQIDLLVEAAGKKRGRTFAEAKADLEKARKEWASSHGGKKCGLSPILLSWGVGAEENIRWREELFQPEKYLTRKDPLLRAALEELSSSFALGVVTNNPVSVARRTLACLGVDDCFGVLVGLDTTGMSKPARAPYEKAAALVGFPPGECVSVGDRFEIDIATPLEMGMGGILVSGVEEVYHLSEVLHAGT